MRRPLKNRLPGILFLLASPGLISGCNPSEPPPSVPIVAVVNEEGISLDDFRTALGEMQFEPDLEEDSEEGRALKRSTLDLLIQEKLIEGEVKRRNFSIPEEELEREFERIKQDNSEEDFALLLSVQNLSLDEWKANLRKELLNKKLIEETVPRDIEFSDEDVKTYYRENRQNFKKPETVNARHIVTENDVTARDILRRLNAGEAFEDLARSLSVSPDRENGGDLGFFSKGEMPEEFDIVFKLKEGEVSPIVQTPYGRHIFKLEKRQPARLIPLEEAEPAIREHLANARHEKLFAIWIEGLRERAKITVNENILYQPIGKTSGPGQNKKD